MKFALAYFAKEETRNFLENNLVAIIGILVGEEKAMNTQVHINIDSSLFSAVLIVLEYFRLGDFSPIPIDTLSILLDTKHKFYLLDWTKKLKPAYYDVGSKFFLGGGFELLCGVPADDAIDGKFLCVNGPDFLYKVTLAAKHFYLRHETDVGVQLNTVEKVLSSIMSFSEEQLKKDNGCELIDKVLECMINLCSKLDQLGMYNKFLMDFAHKMICTQTLVLKVYGWELVGNLVEMANKDHPQPRSV